MKPIKLGRSPRGIRRLFVPVILVIFFFGRQYFAGNNDSQPQPTPVDAQPIAAKTYKVDRVVDGDTLIIEIADTPGSKTRRERLRLLSIDTPETVKENHPIEPWGPEASEFTKKFVAGGEVELEFDKRRVDQYGRFLAYVYVNDQMLNEALVAEGLARVSYYDGDNASILRQLRKAESAAKQDRKGIWSEQ